MEFGKFEYYGLMEKLLVKPERLRLHLKNFFNNNVYDNIINVIANSTNRVTYTRDIKNILIQYNPSLEKIEEIYDKL